MKASAIAAAVMALAVAGCGGGGNDNMPATDIFGNSGNSGATFANSTGTLTSADSNYLSQSYQAAQSEVQQSQVAARKANNANVKALAQQLATEIAAIQQQIARVSQNNRIAINSNLTTQQQTQINTLNSLSGTQFDQIYVSAAVDFWTSLLAATLMQASQGTNVQVSEAASENLLVIEQQLLSAQALLIVLQPTEYLVEIYRDGLFEMQLARLALRKTTDAQVKQFAQLMLNDHQQINANVSALAQQKNQTLPSDLSTAQQQIIAHLSRFSDADFNSAYMDRSVFSHVEDISKTTVEAQQGTDTQITALATQTLPILQQHLQMAQPIAANLQASQLYRLGQALITDMQIAQLARVRTTDNLAAPLAQQVLTEDEGSYAQLVQLARQRNATLPLTISANQIFAVMQLIGNTTANFGSAVFNLMRQQTNTSLQQAQPLTTGSDNSLNNIAQGFVRSLQSRATGFTNGIGTTGTGTTGIGTTGTGTTGTGTTGIGTTGIGTTGIGTTGIGTTGIGTTGIGTTGTGTTGTGTSGIGTSGIGTTGTGTTGTGTFSTGTTGTSTTGIGTFGTGTTGIVGTIGTGTTGIVGTIGTGTSGIGMTSANTL